MDECGYCERGTAFGVGRGIPRCSSGARGEFVDESVKAIV